MIDKRAYEMLVDNYADEILKEASLKSRIGGLRAGARYGIATARSLGVKGTAKAIKNTAKAKQVAHYDKKVDDVMHSSKRWKKGKDGEFGVRVPENVRKSFTRRDKTIAGVIGGSGVVGTGAYATKRWNDKTASEIVADIMYKEAAPFDGVFEHFDEKKMNKAKANSKVRGAAAQQDIRDLYKQKAKDAKAMGTEHRFPEIHKELMKREKADRLKKARNAEKALLAEELAAIPGSSRAAVMKWGKRGAIGAGLVGLGGLGVGIGNHLSNRDVAEKAAELLVEAVMYKQAAYDQMENAEMCFDAGQVALDSIDYQLR